MIITIIIKIIIKNKANGVAIAEIDKTEALFRQVLQTDKLRECFYG